MKIPILILILTAILACTSHAQRNDALTPSPNIICPNFRFDSVPRLDCSSSKCLTPLNSTASCAVFCEVKRTGIVGEPQIPNAAVLRQEGDDQDGRTLPGGSGDLKGGELIEVDLGIEDASLSSDELRVVRETLDYEWDNDSTLKTRTVRIKDAEYRFETMKNMRKAAGHYSRWVYFPLLIESCGTIRSQTLVEPGEECSGEVEEKENICLTAAWTSNGEAVVGWAQRYEFANGSIEGIEQNEKYKKLMSGLVDPVYPAEDSAIGLRVRGSIVAVAAAVAVALAL